jgi:inner membrane protein
VDNITHALFGVSLAELALHRRASPSTRRAFMVAGVVAASAPDLDLLYTGIVEAPLGYLLHHRGHSHTLPGLAVLGALIAAVLRVWPASRAATTGDAGRLAWLVGAGLISHLLLDAANSYGTLLLYPFSTRWYYGDAVFILEPALWAVLGVTVALNAEQRWTRWLVWGLTVVPCVGLAVVNLISWAQLALLLVACGGLVTWMRSQTTRARALTGVGATIAIVAGLMATSYLARAEAREQLQSSGAGAIVDLVLNPEPAAPWCWSVISIEHDLDGPGLRVRRGTLSLAPMLRPVDTCASYRLLSRGVDAPGSTPGGVLMWNREWLVDLAELRSLNTGNCRAAAWLRFARVPFVDNGRLLDLRFDNPLRVNFSAMQVAGGDCPSNVPPWTPPRGSLIAP